MKFIMIVCASFSLMISAPSVANSGNGGGKAFGSGVKCEMTNGQVQHLPRELCIAYGGKVLNM